jgi:hypothetical protein
MDPPEPAEDAGADPVGFFMRPLIAVDVDGLFRRMAFFLLSVRGIGPHARRRMIRCATWTNSFR